jgi:hypothetical protein
MSIEADFYNTNAKFKSLDIENRDGYMQNYLYKIIWHSAVLSGSVFSFDDAVRLFEKGETSKPGKLSEYEKLADLYEAYKAVEVFARSKKVLTPDAVDGFHSLAVRRTNAADNCLNPEGLNDFCEKMNIECLNFEKMQSVELYMLSFEAFFEIRKISPWKSANDEISRLMTHFFQFRFSLFPTCFLSDSENADEMLEMHVRGLNNEISEFLSSQKL